MTAALSSAVDAEYLLSIIEICASPSSCWMHHALMSALYDVAMSHSAKLVVHGKLRGPVKCTQPVRWGHTLFTPSSEEGVAFEMTLPAQNDNEAEQLVGLIPEALRAVIALCWEVWVNPIILDYDFIRSDGTRRVGKHAPIGFRALVDLSQTPDYGKQAVSKIQDAVLHPSDERLVELLSLFALGLEGKQEAAPITGLWAFVNLIEEEANKKKNNIDHATKLAANLRQIGYGIAPDPTRQPSRIRAAALHPTPNDPLPTNDEIFWFMDLARAYLIDRASL